MPGDHRFYGELAAWWPLISPPQEYAEEAAEAATLLRSASVPVRYLDWTWDPDRADSTILTEYAFLLRDADGSVRTVHETHRTGCFATEVWLARLGEAGFEASAADERTTEDRPPRRLFVAHRPAA